MHGPYSKMYIIQWGLFCLIISSIYYTKAPVKRSGGDKGPVITDTYANVVARASDMACLTSEMRKISNRSRFVNCYKPQMKFGHVVTVVI